MNTLERRNEIIEIIKKNKEVKILDLSKQFEVSRETIRNDLNEISNSENIIEKVYGGAVLKLPAEESAYELRKILNSDEKRKIAEAALDLIKDGDTVYLDYGTTVLSLAEIMLNKKNLTVITNTLPIINKIVENDSIDIFVPGGMIRRNEFSFIGNNAFTAIADKYVDIGFFGCAGINNNSGVTNVFEGEVDFSRTMLKQSSNVVILADHTKFGITSYKQLASLEEVDTIITGKVPDSDLKEKLFVENNKLNLVECVDEEG